MNLIWPMDPLGTREEMPWQMNLLLPMAPPWYQSRDDLHTSTQNLADEPTLANGSPHYLSRHDLHTSTHNLEDEPTLANRTPQDQSRDALHATTQNLADEPILADGPPRTRAEMTCIPLHKTWQMNLLWPMEPPVPEQRCLEYQYTKLGRGTYFG